MPAFAAVATNNDVLASRPAAAISVAKGCHLALFWLLPSSHLLPVKCQPHCMPVLCRQPVIDQARELWLARHPALADRIQFVAGDFFDRCPPADM